MFTARTDILTSLFAVGWSTRSSQSANSGFGNASNPNIYDGSFGTGGNGSGGNEGTSIKAKLVNLISATRTLMRSEHDSGTMVLYKLGI